jgi:hypothetical protein
MDTSTVHNSIQAWLAGLGGSVECRPEEDVSFSVPDQNDNGDSMDNAGGWDDLPTLPDQHDYGRTVFQSVAYRWLTASLKRELSLALVPGQDGACFDVFRRLEGGRKEVSTRRPSERITLDLRVDWNPRVFLRQQFGHSAEPLGISSRKPSPSLDQLPTLKRYRVSFISVRPGLFRGYACSPSYSAR